MMTAMSDDLQELYIELVKKSLTCFAARGERRDDLQALAGWPPARQRRGIGRSSS
jgi:hypothetical protein